MGIGTELGRTWKFGQGFQCIRAAAASRSRPVINPAATSSMTMPQPRGRCWRAPIGPGLPMSRTRNSANAANHQRPWVGSDVRTRGGWMAPSRTPACKGSKVRGMATISSRTTDPGSVLPSKTSAREQTGTANKIDERVTIAAVLRGNDSNG